MLLDIIFSILAIGGGLFVGQLAIDWWRSRN